MLTQLALRYVAERVAKGELTKRSATTIRSKLLDFAEATKVDPKKVTRRHVERWLARPGLSPAYRRARLSALRGFCRWCVLNGHMTKDPTLGLKTPRVPKGLPRALSLEETGRVIDAAPDLRTRLICLLMVQEGLRRIEVARAQFADLDARKRTLRVRGKGGGGEPTRTLPLSDETMSVLARYLAEQSVTSGPLIRSHKHPDRGITASHASHLVLLAFRDSGVKAYNGDGKSAHALRHTAAQDMLDQGAELRQVQAALGHSTVKTTEVYLRGEVAGLRDAMAGRSYL